MPDAEFLISYGRFKKEIKKLTAPGIKATDEEMIMSICKELNMTPLQVGNLKISFIEIFNLAQDKQAYMNWYAQPKPDGKF